ncbi:hypothetical protein LVJ94_45575 [Pendulispora rubella]|uniref:Uncharacterized protein n=1 Tax=Pendulispora rubella TaxID=2741070 RepID=A0ABZ2L1G6_9BACT
MNYNPYQAPQTVSLHDGGGPIVPQHPQPWAVGETIQLAWEGFKREWLALAGAHFLVAMIAMVPTLAPAVLLAARVIVPRSASYWVVWGASNAVSLVVSTFFEVGLVRLWLSVARGQTANFATLFGGGNRFFAFLGMRLVTALAMLLGFALLIVPGVILSLGLAVAPFYLVDAEMGPIAAMRESWKATTGHKGDIFLLGLVSATLLFFGSMLCCIGYFVAAPVCSVALAIVYVRLSGRGTATSIYARHHYPGYGQGPYG